MDRLGTARDAKLKRTKDAVRSFSIMPTLIKHEWDLIKDYVVGYRGPGKVRLLRENENWPNWGTFKF